MPNLDDLIAEARNSFKATNASANLIHRLADALEAAGAECDEWRTEHGLVKERSSTRFQAYQQKKRELRAMEIERDAALARIAELEQSLRSESLARRVDATLLHEYERRFAEAAKLHHKRGASWPHSGGTYVCSECGGIWPCPTAVSLGLNEGENEND